MYLSLTVFVNIIHVIGQIPKSLVQKMICLEFLRKEISRVEADYYHI